MRGIGSDVIALGAILGSAAVAGVVTLALAENSSVHVDALGDVAVECATTVVETSPRMVISVGGGDERAVVVAPNVSVRTDTECVDRHVNVVRIEREREAVERERDAVDRARARVDRARERLDRADEHRERRIERVRESLERAEVERVRDLERGLAVRGEQFEGLELQLDGDAIAIDLSRLLESLEVDMEGLQELLRGELDGLELLLESELESGDLEESLRRLEERLERRDGGSGR